MRVCIVNSDLLPVPPVLGGAIEHTLFETASSVRRPKLTVISPWARDLVDHADLDTDTFRHVDISAQASRVRDLLGPRRSLGLDTRRDARLFYYLNGVTDLLEEIDPDVIQVHNRPEFVPYLVEHFPQKRVVLYQHNEVSKASHSARQAARRCHHLIFVSRYLACRFGASFPASRSKATVIHNSVDTRAWHPRLRGSARVASIRKRYRLTPGKTVLFVGRTVPQKGLHHLLDAMALVSSALPGSKLLVVGSPLFGAVGRSTYLRRLKRRASRLGDAVAFTGFIRRQETPFYYAAADVAVVPSVWQEPFGKVVIEAMAAGVPVIGSRCGAIPEIVDDGVEGVLVESPQDAAGLAYKIADLLTDDCRRAEMAAAARQKAVECFDTSVRLKRTRSFYRKLSEDTAS